MFARGEGDETHLAPRPSQYAGIVNGELTIDQRWSGVWITYGRLPKNCSNFIKVTWAESGAGALRRYDNGREEQ